MPSPIIETLRPVHRSAKSRWRSGRSNSAVLTPSLRAPSTYIYSPRRAPVDRYQGGRDDRARRGPRRPARPPSPATAAARRDGHGRDGPVRAVPLGAALARARRRRLRAADVRLRRHLQDAPRRSGGARAAGAGGLSRPGRPRARPRDDADPAPAAGAGCARPFLRLGEAADLVSLAVVPVP